MNNGTCYIHNHFCIHHADDCSHEQFLGGREMIDNEKYQKELIRMWDSVRDDKSKGRNNCEGVICSECQFCDINDNDNDCYEPINAVEMINTVEKWSKEHPQKHKISKLEYDILKCRKGRDVDYCFYWDSLLLALLEKGYFKGATKDMSINYYFDNCEVIKNEND